MLSTNLLKNWTRMYYSNLEYGIRELLRSVARYTLRQLVLITFVGNIRINAKLPNITILSGIVNPHMYIQAQELCQVFRNKNLSSFIFLETPFENENQALPGNGVINPLIPLDLSRVLLGNQLKGRA